MGFKFKTTSPSAKLGAKPMPSVEIIYQAWVHEQGQRAHGQCLSQSDRTGCLAGQPSKSDSRDGHGSSSGPDAILHSNPLTHSPCSESILMKQTGPISLCCSNTWGYPLLVGAAQPLSLRSRDISHHPQGARALVRPWSLGTLWARAASLPLTHTHRGHIHAEGALRLLSPGRLAVGPPFTETSLPRARLGAAW